MDPAEAPICHSSATGLARRLSKVFSSYESSSQHILHTVSHRILTEFNRILVERELQVSTLPLWLFTATMATHLTATSAHTAIATLEESAQSPSIDGPAS